MPDTRASAVCAGDGEGALGVLMPEFATELAVLTK